MRTPLAGLAVFVTALLGSLLWFDNVERVVAQRVGRETVQYVSNIYKYYIAYTLVQEEVERNLQKASVAKKASL